VAGGFINPYPDPIPDDSHHREKYSTGWLGWKNEKRGCLFLVLVFVAIATLIAALILV